MATPATPKTRAGSTAPELAVGILVDHSGSMHNRRLAIHSAVLAAQAKAKKAGIPLAAWAFSDHTPPLRDVIPFGASEVAARNSLVGLDSYGGTTLRPALAAAIKALSGAPANRRVLLVITDGQTELDSKTIKTLVDGSLTPIIFIDPADPNLAGHLAGFITP